MEVSRPRSLDWAAMTLPRAWTDTTWAGEAALLVRGLFRKPRRVRLPPGLPGGTALPRYLLREFHNMPNGYYSQHLNSGYARAFEIVMLGRVGRARDRMAQRLSSCGAVLDVGCGSGRLAGALHRAGVPEVWGLDPCPYLLRIAATRFPGISFVQGLAEDIPFPSARFDAIGACFVLHELPHRIAEQSLAEFRRVLRRGGLLALTEPAPDHFHARSLLALLRLGGVAAIYFRLLAGLVYEPYVRQWHRRDVGEWLARAGFELLEDETALPVRCLVARRG